MRLINLSPFEKFHNYNLSFLNDVSILIKTLERESHLINLLESIRRFGFKGPILIADDSKLPYKSNILSKFSDLDIIYFILPYNSGLSEGRNILLAQVRTPLFLLCDDDFVFDKRSRIPLMISLLEKYQLDILGGVFYQYNRNSTIGKYALKLNNILIKFNYILPSLQYYEFYCGIDVSKEKISLFSIKYNDPVTICDLTHNFFLARTDKIKSFGGWNSELKVGEHENFFIRVKLAGLKVGTTRRCGIVHDQWTQNSNTYKSLRLQANKYQTLALREFGVNILENYGDVLRGKFGEH